MLCAICHDDSCTCACALDCGHAFGPDCIFKWVELTSRRPRRRNTNGARSTESPLPTCPLCRHPIEGRKQMEILLAKTEAFIDNLDTLHPIDAYASDHRSNLNRIQLDIMLVDSA